MSRPGHAASLWAVICAGAFLSTGAAAQSVSPPIAEYQERARSSFQLHNASIFPITAVLEVRGFTITEQGEVIDVPLDTSRIHVKLSEMSFRIPPRGSRTVFYEATGDSLPAWFNILSALTGTKTESGLNVRILLPHVVYLNQKQPLRKEEVAIRRFELDRATQKARVQLENLGPHLGRVYQLNVADRGNASQTAGGFPLMPRSRRWVEVEWQSATPPNRLTLRFARFTIDSVLSPVPASLAADSAAVPSRP
ncbi:MAG TPA: hypothetical protein VFH24_05005 [Gemmatimonadales bacterium]|nr:hypothetical protein [Gemmatimonadales bacterium]